MPQLPLRRVRLHGMWAAQVAAAASPSPQAIAQVDAWNLKAPNGGQTWSLVRVATRDGVEGWGEGRVLTPEAWKTLKATAMGQPASGVEALGVKLRGNPGWAAVNAACLDIMARISKAPVYQYLGGPTRNKVRAYTALHGPTNDDLLRSLEKARGAGFKAFSVPVPVAPFRNSGKAFVLAAEQRMSALRKAAGDGIDFILSGGGQLTPGDAAVLSAAFERTHLLWFDEPCATSAMGTVRKVSEESVTPVGFGRGAMEASFFQNLLREDAVDVLRPEIATHGISGVRKIAALGEVYYGAVAPRHGEGPLTTATALNLAASLPNFFIQHIPYPDAQEDRDMRRALTGSDVETVKDGYAALINQPGLGVSIQRDALRKFGEAL